MKVSSEVLASRDPVQCDAYAMRISFEADSEDYDLEELEQLVLNQVPLAFGPQGALFRDWIVAFSGLLFGRGFGAAMLVIRDDEGQHFESSEGTESLAEFLAERARAIVAEPEAQVYPIEIWFIPTAQRSGVERPVAWWTARDEWWARICDVGVIELSAVDDEATVFCRSSLFAMVDETVRHAARQRGIHVEPIDPTRDPAA